MYRTDFWNLWENASVGCFERTASKHVYYQGWNRSPAQVGCMRQVLGPGALGRPRGIGWGGRQEGGSGWGTHVNPWLIHVNLWQKPLQCCKVISLQLIKINGDKKKKRRNIIPNWRLLVSVLQWGWGVVLVTGLTQGSSNLYGRVHLGLTYFLVWVRKFYNAEGQMSACRKLLAMQMILVW